MIANRHGGAGLGLWISLRIVDAHGGEVDVESEPGEGTRVRVWLPEVADKSMPSGVQQAS
jgi:signal transduction histidine kinase